MENWVGPKGYRRQWRDVKTLINKNSRFLCTGIIFIMLSEKLTVFDPLKQRPPSKAEYITYKLHSAVIIMPLLLHRVIQ